MSVAITDGFSSSCVCYALSHYRHCSSLTVPTQHLWGLQKLRGRGHDSAQLWQITINSLLQAFHVFRCNVVLQGTSTPCSQQSQKLLEGYSKIHLPISISNHKNPPWQLGADVVPNPFQQQLDTSECGAALAGPVWSITTSPAGGRSVMCCRSQSPSCSFSIASQCQLSWTSFLDTFPFP